MRQPTPKSDTTTAGPDAYLTVTQSLEASRQRQEESEWARFLAEASMPPIAAPSPARGEAAQPSGSTDGQTSRWKQMEWRDGGEDRGGLVTEG